VKKLLCMLIFASVIPMLSGCPSKGSSAPPPSGLKVTPGDGRVKVEWTPDSGVDYWLFTSTDPSLSAFNWLGLPNLYVYPSVATPFYACGLYNGTTYYFASNGRINGGPGGSSSATLNEVPYNASANWAANTALSSANLYGAGYTSLTTCSNNSTSAAGSFTAVGAGGAIYTSADGISWVNQAAPSGFITDLYAVTGYAANQNNPANPALRWVAVGDGGASVYSLDGTNWAVGNAFNANSPANPGNYALHAITQISGTFFAVGDMGTILSSADGITWTSHTATSGTTNNLYGVNMGTIYVAAGDNGTIVTSIDGGSTWTAQTSVAALTASNLRQVTTFGSIVVAVGEGGTIVTSKDSGATWSVQTLPGVPNLVGVAAEYRSVDMTTAITDPQLEFISTVQFVAVDSTGNAYTSENGYTWSAAIPTGTPGLNALVSSGFGYVAAGNAGATAYAF